ncbi:hypothetical protein HOLleu_18531 [Holothuria leucospilota]|uniref:Uncharacterized protein n=1 Tax=Holothuria leucospilota TaxID=206669 RepID=A0A9Q1H9Y0_HOLLE|nr:hypothetical protein HOLleu_18531 [Holothuria leucospilota]
MRRCYRADQGKLSQSKSDVTTGPWTGLHILCVWKKGFSVIMVLWESTLCKGITFTVFTVICMCIEGGKSENVSTNFFQVESFFRPKALMFLQTYIRYVDNFW